MDFESASLPTAVSYNSARDPSFLYNSSNTSESLKDSIGPTDCSISEKKSTVERKLSNPNESSSSDKKSSLESHNTTSNMQQGTSSNSNNNPSFKNYKYDKNNQGPFEVHIQPEEKKLWFARPFNYRSSPQFLFKKKTLEIKKTGFAKISVYFKNYEAANNLINNPILKIKKLTAFIPTFRTCRYGVIKEVPLGLSDEEIKQGLECPFTTISTRRLNRRMESENSSPKYSPSKTILITFKRTPDLPFLSIK